MLGWRSATPRMNDSANGGSPSCPVTCIVTSLCPEISYGTCRLTWSPDANRMGAAIPLKVTVIPLNDTGNAPDGCESRGGQSFVPHKVRSCPGATDQACIIRVSDGGDARRIGEINVRKIGRFDG